VVAVRGGRAAARRTPVRIAALACAAFVAGILAGLALALVSCVCAGVLLLAFMARDRSPLRWTLVPWRLLVFVAGLFLVVQTLSRHGLSTVLGTVLGTDLGALGVLRAAATGSGLANLIGNCRPT
jgi:arsenical pump membrane protein